MWIALSRIARRPHAAAVLALVAIAFGVYSGVLDHAFLLNWDDHDYVVRNEAIRGLSWENVRTAFGRPYFGNYAPLHLLSYAVDHAVWGMSAGGFLFTNVLLHGANGALLHVLLVRLGAGRAAAALAAALFLVHPVQVESVAWISERKNVLCMAFLLAALHGYAAYRAPGARRRAWTYSASFAAAAAALLTKAAAVVIAPLLVLFDLCHVEPSARRRWVIDKAPFVLATVAIAAATISSQREMIAEGRAAYSMDPPTTLYTMVPVVARYLGMLAWPAGLSAIYAPAVREGADLAFAASAALLTGLAALGVLLFRRRRPLFFWYAAFFLGLVPVLQIVPLPTLMNDRYLYFPMLGASAFAALALEPVLKAGRDPLRRAAKVAAAVAVAVLALLSHARVEVWRDDLSLWQDAAAKDPRSALAWAGLGMSLLDGGRGDEALHAFLSALAIDPAHRLALNDAGALWNERGEPLRGRPYLVRAVSLWPDYFPAYMNLGRSYLMTGELGAAEEAFRAALRIEPAAPEALSALADVRRRMRP
jgi:tetratricopeptide (TPR) repeat protein